MTSSSHTFSSCLSHLLLPDTFIPRSVLLQLSRDSASASAPVNTSRGSHLQPSLTELEVVQTRIHRADITQEDTWQWVQGLTATFTTAAAAFLSEVSDVASSLSTNGQDLMKIIPFVAMVRLCILPGWHQRTS